MGPWGARTLRAGVDAFLAGDWASAAQHYALQQLYTLPAYAACW